MIYVTLLFLFIINVINCNLSQTTPNPRTHKEPASYMSFNVTLSPLRTIQSALETVHNDISYIAHGPGYNASSPEISYIAKEIAGLIENAAEPIQKLSDITRNALLRVKERFELAANQIEQTAEQAVTAAIKPIQDAVHL